MRILPRDWSFTHQLESLEARRALSVSEGEPVFDEVPVLLNGAGSELVFEDTFQAFGADDDLYDFGGPEGDEPAGVDEEPSELDLTPLFDPAAVSVGEDVSGFNEWDAAWLGDADAGSVPSDDGDSADEDLYNFGEYLTAGDDLVTAESEVHADAVIEPVAILEGDGPQVIAGEPAVDVSEQSMDHAAEVQISAPMLIEASSDVNFVSLAAPDLEPGSVGPVRPGIDVSVSPSLAQPSADWMIAGGAPEFGSTFDLLAL